MALDLVIDDSCTIVENLVDGVARQVRYQFVVNALGHLLLREHECVHTRREDLRDFFFPV